MINKCKICGKEFHVKLSWKNRRGFYCSRKCFYLSYAYQIRRRKSLTIGLRVILTCACCGKSFKRLKCAVKNGRQFCSLKCRYKFPRRGEISFNWKDGRSSLNAMIRRTIEYKEWRGKVFKRDNYRCQECFKTDCYLESHHKKSFAKLLSEFLKEYNQFSPYEEKEILVRLAIKWRPFWDIDNGETLCEDCHRLTNNYKKKALREMRDEKKI